ncbi:MAG: hypothetical protein ACLP0J_21325 [Solirubrobacteraceae bacterium]
MEVVLAPDPFELPAALDALDVFGALVRRRDAVFAAVGVSLLLVDML